jgi:predicted Zn-dependent protease
VVRLHDPKAAAPEAAPGLDDALATVSRLLREGETEAARLEAEALVSAHPTESRVHLAAAQVQLEAGRHREAEAAARRALALEPLLGLAHRLLGDALVAQGRFGEGVAWWERWLTLARHDPAHESDRARVRAAAEAARTLESLLQGDGG